MFADRHGRCVHLFERDCSLQRRHQKVIEEAPAPGLTAAHARRDRQRPPWRRPAPSATTSAGTVEFIARPDGEFYFIEMNTRLQVEHPVTEVITGLDLVEWQLRIAAGEPLPLRQDEIACRGHAIEARLYAEDPERGFLPSIGRLRTCALPPAIAGVRVDTGVEEGDAVTPYYDPMIAKLIVHGATREEARRRLQQALERCRIVGVENNVAFLARLVQSASFVAADLDTALIEREAEALFPPLRRPRARAGWQWPRPGWRATRNRPSGRARVRGAGRRPAPPWVCRVALGGSRRVARRPGRTARTPAALRRQQRDGRGAWRPQGWRLGSRARQRGARPLARARALDSRSTGIAPGRTSCATERPGTFSTARPATVPK